MSFVRVGHVLRKIQTYLLKKPNPKNMQPCLIVDFVQNPKLYFPHVQVQLKWATLVVCLHGSLNHFFRNIGSCLR